MSRIEGERVVRVSSQYLLFSGQSKQEHFLPIFETPLIVREIHEVVNRFEGGLPSLIKSRSRSYIRSATAETPLINIEKPDRPECGSMVSAHHLLSFQPENVHTFTVSPPVDYVGPKIHQPWSRFQSNLYAMAPPAHICSRVPSVARNFANANVPNAAIGVVKIEQANVYA